jgi:hypothetical protein
MSKKQYYKTVLMACTIAFIILWYLEYQRTTLAESYWLALAAMASLMGYQYVRMSSQTNDDKTGLTSGKGNTVSKSTHSKPSKKKK